MLTKLVFVTSCICAAVTPIVRSSPVSLRISSLFVFPVSFEGKTLTELALTERELKFNEGFPGTIKRYTDGVREIVIKHVVEPTRKVHPAVDCFHGAGYKTKPLPITRDATGKLWGCFEAIKNTDAFEVCEIVLGSQKSWSDISSWYWETLWEEQQSEFTIYVVLSKK